MPTMNDNKYKTSNDTFPDIKTVTLTGSTQ